jgi:hypothetical protein
MMGEQKRRQAINPELIAKTTRHSTSSCLNCGYEIDASTITGSTHSPKPGNIGICIRCSHIMAYDEELKVRELTSEEMKAVAGNENVLRYINSLETTKRLWEAKHGKGSWVKREGRAH